MANLIIDPFARRSQNQPAPAILKSKYGNSYFLRQTPFEDRYYALAEIAHLAGRAKAARIMAVYAAIEGFIKDARPPFGFLQAYGMKDSDSRMARAIALSVCIKIGANDRAAKIQSQDSMSKEEMGKFIMEWPNSSRYLARRAKGETFAPLPEDKALKKFYISLRKGVPVTDGNPLLAVESKAVQNLAMAQFGTDAVIFPPEMEN